MVAYNVNPETGSVETAAITPMVTVSSSLAPTVSKVHAEQDKNTTTTPNETKTGEEGLKKVCAHLRLLANDLNNAREKLAENQKKLKAKDQQLSDKDLEVEMLQQYADLKCEQLDSSQVNCQALERELAKSQGQLETAEKDLRAVQKECRESINQSGFTMFKLKADYAFVVKELKAVQEGFKEQTLELAAIKGQLQEATNRVEELESENAQLEDELAPLQEATTRVEELEAENAQLEDELAQMQSDWVIVASD